MLASGETLQSGKAMISENGLYTLKIQSDGNIVLYKVDVDPWIDLWASGTTGKGNGPYTMTMQSNDNHLILHDTNSKVICAPNVYIGNDGLDWATGGYATLQTDGNFVVYDGYDNVMWSTAAAGGQIGKQIRRNIQR